MQIQSDVAGAARPGLMANDLHDRNRRFRGDSAHFTRRVRVEQKIAELDEQIKKNPNDSKLVDMYEAGIIDPVKVTRSGVENAASAAAVLLTTEAAVADLPEDKKAPTGGGMGGGMDMD